MTITNAQYLQFNGENTVISATIDGVEMSVPLCEGNRHYDAILKAVENGDLVIEEAQP